MTLRVNNIRVPIEQPEEALRQALAEAIGVSPHDLTHYRILRKSLDARSRNEIVFVYSAAVDLGEDEQRVFQSRRDSRVDFRLFSQAGSYGHAESDIQNGGRNFR